MAPENPTDQQTQQDRDARRSSAPAQSDTVTGETPVPLPAQAQSETEASAPSGFPIVGIGASAGGLGAFFTLFDQMPADSGMAFVLIQHLDPTQQSHMASLIATHTEMPVTEVNEPMRIEPDHVYIIRPDQYLEVEGGELKLSRPSEPRGQRRHIDVFLRSLAEDQRERAVGVILSGTGSNGAEGIKAVKLHGGMTLAQDPETAEYEGMPLSAVNTGEIDHILGIERMPEVLRQYAHHPYIQLAREQDAQLADGQWEQVKTVLSLLRAREGREFRYYKKPTLLRRIFRRMGLNQIAEVDRYVQFLRDHPDELHQLARDLLITVSSFFRDSEAWEALQRDVVAPLLRDREDHAPIRAWIPACATGEEAYTVAMIFTEQAEAMGKSLDLKVFATDVGDEMLKSAREGMYPEAIAGDISKERLERFFEKRDNSYQVVKPLRESVVFAPQDLINDPPFSRLDLISCRNLLIYLEPEVQEKLLNLFHFALREGGYLFLGNAETIGRSDLYTTVSKKWRIYRRVGPTRHDLIDFPLFSTEQGRRKLEALDRPAPQRKTNLQALTQQALMEHHTPAAVLINEEGRTRYFHGATDQYLAQPSGEPTYDLMDMAREGLHAKLKNAIQTAIREDRRVSIPNARIKREGAFHTVEVTAVPLPEDQADEKLLMVSFQDQPQPPTPPTPPASSTADGTGARAKTGGDGEADENRLQQELRSTREELQSTIEELETSNEELKASNEEVTSMNEELQSSNEELETSKEELQSLNEELNTVNAQLQSKVEELEDTNNDLHNLLASTDIAVLFLDTHFQVRRFTRAVKDLIDLRDSDIGRPISHFTQKFTDGNLLEDARSVLDHLVPVWAEVRMGEDRWFSRCILPYRTQDDRIDGVVVTFTDITDFKRSQQQLSELNDTLEQRVEQRTWEARRRARQLRRLSSQLSEAEHRERRRLAQVLHDNLQQYLVAAKMKVDALHKAADAQDPRPALEQMRNMIDEAIEASRSLTVELSPPILYDGGLCPALHWLGRRMEEKHSLRVEVACGDDVEIEVENLRVLLFNAVRELLFNVVKHAGADHASVHAQLEQDDRVRITVGDGGAGFDPDKLTNGEEAGDHFGLMSIRERLEMLSGEMRLDSAPGQGARITLLAPLQDAQDGEEGTSENEPRS